MIRFEDVQFTYRDRRILHGVSFEVAEGDTLVVLGGSGSGKTTVLRLIMGFVKPDAGAIFIDGEDISHLKEREMIEIRRKMGMVFQFGALFDSLTVGDNVAFPLRELRTMTETDIIAQVTEVIQQVGLNPSVLDQKPSELSGGMNRRVAFARAVINRPRVMLYDEPTTGLDPLACQVVCDLVLQLQREFGVTSLFVTHQLAAAFRVGNRFILLQQGNLVFNGTSDALRHSQDPYISEFINWEIGGLLNGTSEKSDMERSPGRAAGS